MKFLFDLFPVILFLGKRRGAPLGNANRLRHGYYSRAAVSLAWKS